MKTSTGSESPRDLNGPAVIYEFGPFLMDPSVRRLFVGGRPVRLTSKLFDLLLMLVSNSGEVMTKEELMQKVWPDQFVEESNLTVSMSALRKALGERYKERKYIETVPKRGYRFVARVDESRVAATEGRGRGGGGGWGTWGGVAEKSAISLAVLPLVNEGRDPDLEYLADGLAESFINSLSRIPQLRVLARTTVFRYKGKELDVLRVGGELNVRALLTGRVLQRGGRLLINVELIDAEDGAQMWGAKYDRLFSNIFEVQEEITAEVWDKLKLRLSPREKGLLNKRHTGSTEAFRHYLKGRFFWNKRSITGIRKAVGYFRRALDLDPDYSLAYSGLADGYITLADYGVVPPREVVPKAREAAARALMIDDTLAEAYTSSASVKKYYGPEFARAERDYMRAIELNPRYATAHHWYGDYLAKLARFDEAVERIKQALEIDPLSLIVNKTMAKILYMSRRFDRAVEQCLEIFELDPAFGPANGLLSYVYAAQGRYEEAISEIQKLIDFTTGEYEVSPGGRLAPAASSLSDPEAIAALGYFYALAGRRGEALRLLDGLRELRKRRYVEPHTLAMIFIGLGDKDGAFEWLGKSCANRSSVLGYLKVWPVLDPLRSDSRFADLCRRASTLGRTDW
ncbi:MAG TPA: winged helix-turn-helix domain-containing protein [Pyrinomonadaceae bacterium]|jgi:TolB-like protein/DNA-binding winged helix-turn-helix (wHTH) protein/tetratricopeptide (TPR) repeat protein|nr:winged helix-turn-helix domain-containing protein [Pyrinomonadaceae bacterium]